MASKADTLFWKILAAAAVPAGAVGFALTRAAHDLQAVLASTPSPVAGLCREAISYTLDPLAHASYVGFGALAIVSVALGTMAAVVTLMRTRRRLRSELLPDSHTPVRLRLMAERIGLPRVRLLRVDEPRAYTFGFLRPAAAVSSGLLERLDDVGLEAVLRHEAAHARHRDPLRMLVVSSVARAFVFAPIVRRLADSFRIAKEIDADGEVVTAMGSSQPLAAALLAAIDEPGLAEAGLASFSDTLMARIAWLEGDDPLPTSTSGWRAMAITTVALLAIAAGLFVITTGAVDAHVLHICADSHSGV